MPHEFLLPDIGEGLTDAEIVEWHVAQGDQVDVDQPIVDIETAKTTVEITSTHAGTLLALAGPPGTIVDVGDILFAVGNADESVTLPHSTIAQQIGQTGSVKTNEDVSRPATSAPQRQRAMPNVRKFAAQNGIDLATINGSGSRGTITRTDVQNAIDPGTTASVEPLSRTRKAIAAHMTESWTTIPHVTVQADVRAENLLQARKRTDAPALPLEAIVGVAVLPLLVRYREFNASIHGDAVEYKNHINLGFAVDTDAGLIVAVVKDANTLTVDELASEIGRLAVSARDRTLTPDQTTGQTFTISNIGALGGGHGTPIIPLGTSAILSVGRAREAAVVVDGEIAAGMVAPIDLSYDHRLIDGGLGQRFLSDLVENLESDAVYVR